MPIISALGAMSSRGLGEFAQSQAQGKYIEDYFSTYLWAANSSQRTIANNIPLITTGAWNTYSVSTTNNNTQSAADTSGNIYIAGAALTKVNSAGTFQWSRRVQLGSYYMDMNGVAVGSAGDVYVVGTVFDGSVAQCFAIVKYNSSGTLQWSKYLTNGAVIGSYGYGITLDSSDNVYVAGQYVNSSGLYYGYFLKLNSAGTVQFQRTYRETSWNVTYGITLDSSGNIYVCGDATGTFHVAKWDSTGNLLWGRKLADTTANSSSGRQVSVDSSGNVYVAGYATASALQYGLVAKYNSSGTLQWQRKFTNANSATARGIFVDSSGNVHVSGYSYNGTNYYINLLKYDSSGNNIWNNFCYTSSTGADFYGYGLSADAAGNIYVATIANNLPTTIKYNSAITSFAGYSNPYLLSPSSNTLAAGTATGSNSTENTSSLGTAYSSGLTSVTVTYTSSLGSQAESTDGAGLVWIKWRSGGSGAGNNALWDTARGASYALSSNSTNGNISWTNSFLAFNSNGFTLGPDAANVTNAPNGNNFASWTFRKSTKFFDVVTYTGDGTTGRVINHNLGSSPGMIVFKNYSGVSQWPTWHRSLAANNILFLNTNAASASSSGYVSAVSSTTFTINANVNTNGATFVAYLFAHDAGGFGADGSQNVISCGSFTTDGSGNATVSLGYEPQYVLYKVSSTTGGWNVTDIMRGMPVGGNTATLAPNDANAEYAVSNDISPTATGFNVTISGAASRTYIYMAIRRGPMRTPTSGTSVFTPISSAATAANAVQTSGFPVDWIIAKQKNGTNPPTGGTRLLGGSFLTTNTTDAETAWDYIRFDNNTGYYVTTTGTYFNASSAANWMLGRAPGFFDVVCYTGTGVARTINHNLGVVPEMMIVKPRSNGGTALRGWSVYVSALGNGYTLLLQTVDGKQGAAFWNYTSPTSSVFSVDGSYPVNESGTTFVAYLFATCPGVSKVGSYTGTGSTQTISCGFTGGARFVMIKRTDAGGPATGWYTFDTARGMVAGTDPYLLLNSTAAETNANNVYTATGGFQIVSSDSGVNANGASYIYLAIA